MRAIKKPFAHKITKAMTYLLVSLALCVALTGCNKWWNRDADIATMRSSIDARMHDIEGMKAALAELTKLAETTGNESIISAMNKTKEALVIAEDALPKMQAELAELEKGGPKVPLWTAALALAQPLLPRVLRLIPGPGGVIASWLLEIAYKVGASKTERLRDNEAHALLDKTKPLPKG